MFKKLKDKKGFTLVELIVVLVILAILAALLVPSLTGYIDKAKEEQMTSQTRMVLMAANAELATADGNSVAVKAETNAENGFADPSVLKGIIENAELSSDKYGYTITVKGYKVQTIVLSNGTTKCTYTASTNTYKTEAAATSDPAVGTFAIALAS